VKSMMSVILGLLLGIVGLDPMSGVNRFTLDQMELMDGINFIVVVMGFSAWARSWSARKKR